jgi:hypothetical protein
MLQHEMLTDKGVLIARPKGPLSREDFSALSADADAFINVHGALNGLMICAEKFPGWKNLEGFIAHFKFVRDHHKKISRVAFVSDSEMLTLLPRFANHFVGAEVQHFPTDREKDALAWVGG